MPAVPDPSDGIPEPILRKLLQIGLLISSKLGLRELIEAVIEVAGQAVPADRISLWLVDDNAHELYTFVGEGLDQEIRIPIGGQGIVNECVVARREINVPCAYEHASFDKSWDTENGYTTYSVLCVPISRGNRVVACLQFINRKRGKSRRRIYFPAEERQMFVGRFTSSDARIARTIADYIGVAVEKSLLVGRLKSQSWSAIKMLADVTDGRDPTTGDHTKLVTAIAVAIAREMGLSQHMIERVMLAAILHDVGKISIPDRVLRKKGPLNKREWSMMRRHPTETRNRLARLEFARGFEDILFAAGAHHEKMDGSGYPDGLKGDEIPIEARIIAPADVYQALTQERPYKPAKPSAQAYGICCEMEGTHLYPPAVAALGAVLDRCGGDPTTLVELINW
ncbi:MAG: HD domain-containing phosphohydrolase [Patescibacteria group bacterium]|jgi:HD-GYP domain-containing protein (c-di-GMP phosphodiesterase class II)